jgi:hypothetical protein
MPRILSPSLNAAQFAETRSSKMKVYIYDVQSGDNTIVDIIRGTALSTTTGPRDFSDDIESVTWTDVMGSYTTSAVAASMATIIIVDPNRLFDPANLVDDPTGDGRWLRRRNVVRLVVGDEQVSEEEWKTVFTGRLVGSPGVRRTRASGFGPISQISVKALTREAEFIRFKSTSDAFSKSTSYQTLITDIAQQDMGLDSDELDLTTFTSRTTGHGITQFVDEEPLVSIARIMFLDGFMPKFNGEGQLSQTAGIITKSPSRVYQDDDLILLNETPFSELDPINYVEVLGLDSEMSKVSQPNQVLATIRITTGYFTFSEEVEAFWSDDHTQLAENIELEIIKSVNAGIIPLGGDEEFTEIPAPGSGTGTIGAELTIDTGFAPYVIIFFTAVYVALSFVPDEVLLFVTVPVGRVIQAIELALVLLMMARVGSGHYNFRGEPFEWVFKEIRGQADTEGLLSYERNSIEIENHLVQDQSTADSLALTVLNLEQARGNPRTVTMLQDLLLEAADVFQSADDRKYFIEKIQCTYTRGARAILAAMACFEVTSGSFQ